MNLNRIHCDEMYIMEKGMILLLLSNSWLLFRDGALHFLGESKVMVVTGQKGDPSNKGTYYGGQSSLM